MTKAVNGGLPEFLTSPYMVDGCHIRIPNRTTPLTIVNLGIFIHIYMLLTPTTHIVSLSLLDMLFFVHIYFGHCQTVSL